MLAASASADTPSEPVLDIPPTEELYELDFEDLMNVSVFTATKAAQDVAAVPAVVATISREQIRRAGYRSLSDALRSVCGMVANTDHVYTNVGLRGTSGGLRGGSRHIKVLLNGQAIAFRSDAQNFLGPEGVPMDALDRIEVIRGPASALYGQNSFLGVVNVITRRVESEGARASVGVDAGVVASKPAAGGSVHAAFAAEGIEVAAWAHLEHEDRSGFALPKSSPHYGRYESMRSKKDLSTPITMLATAHYDMKNAGEFSAQLLYRELDARGEFVDTGALTHATRFNLWSVASRLAYEVELDALDLRGTMEYSEGAPTKRDRIHPAVQGVPVGYRVSREFAFRAVAASVEAVAQDDIGTLTVGLEGEHDREVIRQNRFRFGSKATVLGPNLGVEAFKNLGIYGQATSAGFEPFAFSANLRYDFNSHFQNNFNYRGALVWMLGNRVNIKVLSGSSYRAPSPEQLYATSMFPGDAEGSRVATHSAALKPQRAHTHELLIGHYGEDLRAEGSVYVVFVRDRIEYLLREGHLKPANRADSQTLGAELALRARTDLTPSFRIDFSFGASYNKTRFDVPTATTTPRQRETLEFNEIFPDWTLHGDATAMLPPLKLSINVGMDVCGERLQSQTNQLIGRPMVGDPMREVRTSYPLRTSISVGPVVLLSGGVSLWARLSAFDLFNTASPDPGFNGINVPSLGRRAYRNQCTDGLPLSHVA